MSKNSAAFAAVALTLVSFALATAASAKPIYQPVSPSLQPINGGSMYKPVNPGLKPINNGSIYKPVNPALQPIGKKNGGCPNGWVGCNPNTWGPGKSGGGLVVDISVGVAQPVATVAAVADANCYYVRRKVFIEGVGLVRQRMLVCD